MKKLAGYYDPKLSDDALITVPNGDLRKLADPDSAAFAAFAAKHTFDEIFDGRATPPAAVVPGTREAMEHITELLVDSWSEVGEGDPEDQKAVMDARALLSAPVPPADGALTTLRDSLTRLATRHVGAWIKESNPALQMFPVAADQDIRDFVKDVLTLFPPSGTGAAEPVARELDGVLNSLMLAVHDNQGNVPFVKSRLRAVFKEVLQPLYALPPVRGDREAIAQNNLREAWAALAMIREAIETLGPIGALPASEHLAGPTFTHEAEALVAGIVALSLPVQSSAPVSAIAKLQEIVDLDPRGRYGRLAREAINEIQSSDGGVGSQTRKEPSADAQSLMAAGNVDSLGVAPGPSEALSSAPEATVSGETVDWIIYRDPGCVAQRKGPFSQTKGELAGFLREMIEHHPNAYLTVLTLYPHGDFGLEDGPNMLQQLDGRSASIAQKHRDRLKALTASPQDVGREATIEECALVAVTPLTDEQKDNIVNGFGALLRFEAIWNLAQKTSVAAIRSLSRKGGER